MNRCRLIVSMSVAVLLAGCSCRLSANEQEGDINKTTENFEVQSAPVIVGEVGLTAEKPVPGRAPGPGMQEAVDVAMDDLAKKLGIKSSEINLLDAQSVIWRDSSIGCPEADTEYMQVLTHGSRIRLRANNRVFQYHSGENGPPFLCSNPVEPEPSPFGPDGS